MGFLGPEIFMGRADREDQSALRPGRKRKGKSQLSLDLWMLRREISTRSQQMGSSLRAQRFHSPGNLLPRKFPHPHRAQRKVFSGFFHWTWVKVFLSSGPAWLGARA